MTELLRYSKLYLEDIALGTGNQEVILADGRVTTLRKINIGNLFQERSTVITPTAGALQTISGLIPAGARLVGVTVKILSLLGNASGLTSFDVGEASIGADQWGNSIAISEGTVTSQADFSNNDTPIYAADADVLLSARGGNFEAVGRIELKSKYYLLTHD